MLSSSVVLVRRRLLSALARVDSLPGRRHHLGVNWPLSWIPAGGARWRQSGGGAVCDGDGGWCCSSRLGMELELSSAQRSLSMESRAPGCAEAERWSRVSGTRRGPPRAVRTGSIWDLPIIELHRARAQAQRQHTARGKPLSRQRSGRKKDSWSSSECWGGAQSGATPAHRQMPQWPLDVQNPLSLETQWTQPSSSCCKARCLTLDPRSSTTTPSQSEHEPARPRRRARPAAVTTRL